MGEILETLMPFVWVLIPLTMFGVGAFLEWLKFKEKQAKLGASTDELVKEVKSLKESIAEKDREMTKRLQNLETIVTSQVWDAINAEKENLPPHLLDQVAPLEKEEVSDTQKAEEIARRLKS